MTDDPASSWRSAPATRPTVDRILAANPARRLWPATPPACPRSRSPPPIASGRSSSGSCRSDPTSTRSRPRSSATPSGCGPSSTMRTRRAAGRARYVRPAAGRRPLCSTGARRSMTPTTPPTAPVDRRSADGFTRPPPRGLLRPVETARLLLDRGADPESMGDRRAGRPAAPQRRRRRHEDVAALLVERGADVGLGPGALGFTPLMQRGPERAAAHCRAAPGRAPTRGPTTTTSSPRPSWPTATRGRRDVARQAAAARLRATGPDPSDSQIATRVVRANARRLALPHWPDRRATNAGRVALFQSPNASPVSRSTRV